jgi:uncharacterized protein YjiS (DUF1127 family)
MRLAHAPPPETSVVTALPLTHMSVMRKGKRPSGPIRSQVERTETMKTLIARIRAEAAKRATYRTIRDEIARLPRAIAIDIGIFPEDAERIAYKAVWG